MRVAGYFKADLLRDEFHRIAIAQGFTPRIIEITGRNHTDKQDIAAIANQMKGKSILAIDLMAMREDILQLGWVEDVVIIRTLPDKLEIRLSERQPVALLQSAKGHQLIDASGAVIHGANPADFNHLIVASGKGAAERAGMIVDILRTEPEIFDVWAVNISPKDAGIFICAQVWLFACRTRSTGLVTLAKLEQETAITARDLAAIDLRVPGLIVEPNIPIRGKEKNLMAKRYPSAKSPFAVVDLGSSRFACLIAEIGAEGKPSLLGQAIHAAEGIRQGEITDMARFSTTLGRVVKLQKAIPALPLTACILLPPPVSRVCASNWQRLPLAVKLSAGAISAGWQKNNRNKPASQA